MKTIFKYKLPFLNEKSIIDIDMPINAKIISCNRQDGNIVVWAEVDTNAQSEKISFRVVCTGEAIESFMNMTYLNTVFFGCLVLHVYKIEK